MSELRQPPDELELKKRARRRLVGAVAFATFAAVVLPMVMDETPPPAGRDIELRIPGQDQLTSSPLTPAKAPTGAPALATKPPVVGESSGPAKAAVADAAAPPVAALKKPETPPPAAKPASKPSIVEAAKGPTAAPVATPARTVEALAKSAVPPDARRAQAILENQGAATSDAGGPYVVLIGAFANAANVRILQAKLGQLGIRTYTENLDSSQGRKTRVRAGPFASRDAAEKALDKMKRIGVGGVVAAKS